MIHTVRDWMTSPVLVVDPDSSVFYAATLMRRRNVRSLVVDLTAEKGGYGIVTSTDVSNKVLLAENNLAEMTLCTEIFEIESERFFINAYDNYW